jgi:hypothetical protein
MERFSYEELYELAKSKEHEYLDRLFCPVYNRCPEHHEFPFKVDKENWIIRNCPKFREMLESIAKGKGIEIELK